jgi:hypothetical protein
MIETVKHFPDKRFTIASIYDPESGEMKIGLAFAAPEDNFSRKEGYHKAMGRAGSSVPTCSIQGEQRLSPKEITHITIESAEYLFTIREDIQHKLHQEDAARKKEKEIQKLENRLKKLKG